LKLFQIVLMLQIWSSQFMWPNSIESSIKHSVSFCIWIPMVMNMHNFKLNGLNIKMSSLVLNDQYSWSLRTKCLWNGRLRSIEKSFTLKLFQVFKPIKISLLNIYFFIYFYFIFILFKFFHSFERGKARGQNFGRH
jgi:hypothetical protein